MQRDVLGNGDYKRHLGFYRLFNRGCGLVSRYIYGCGVWPQLGHCLHAELSAIDRSRGAGAGAADRADRGEHRQTEVLAGAARGHASNNVGSPGD